MSRFYFNDPKLQWVDENLHILKLHQVFKTPEYVYILTSNQRYQAIFPSNLFKSPEEAIKAIETYKAAAGTEF